MTAGFQRNNLIIIAARPAMGKSSLLNDFALAAALKRTNPVPTVIFTLEMSRHELVKRFLASEAKVDSQRISRGTLQEQDWGRLSGGDRPARRGSHLHRRHARTSRSWRFEPSAGV